MSLNPARLPHRTRWTFAIALLIAALACLVVAFKTRAANPTSGTITPNSQPLSWTGTAALGANTVDVGEVACVEQPGVHVNCDTFTLTVAGTPADWAGKEIQIDISWVVLASDYDVYVHRDSNAGPIVAQSAINDLGNNEIVRLKPTDLEADGSTVFTVHVVYSIATEGDQYLGVARVISAPGDVPSPLTRSTNWKINYHGECCEGNLAAAGNNTYVLLPVLVNGNKIKRSTNGGQTWELVYPPAPASFPFGIEGDMLAFGNDVIFFGTELADAVIARSQTGGTKDSWVTTQAPLASGGNDQAWAYLGPFNDMRPGGRLPTDEDYVIAGWMRIGSAIAFSFDGGVTFTEQRPLAGGGASGSENVVCQQNATAPPNTDPGDTRVAHPLFANQKAGRHGTWGTDRKFYWTETAREESSGDRSLYVCQTADFGTSWTGTKHPLPSGPGVGFAVSHSAFDRNGTFYVLHGDKLYVSFNQGKTFAFIHTLPRYGNAGRADSGSDQYFTVDCGTIHIALQEAGPNGSGRIIYMRGTRADTATPTWDQELVDEPGNVRLDFMYIVLDGNGIPTISYTTPGTGKQVTTASRNRPMGALGGNACSLVSVKAVSRKTHQGTATPFDISLPLDAAPATPGVECRRGTGANNGNHQVVVSVGAAPTFSGVLVTPANGKTAELDGTPVLDPVTNEITINLTNVSDDQTLTITLQNLSAAGGSPVNFNIPMGVALGDTNGDGTVNSGDAQDTRNRSGQLIDAANFRSDVNRDGTVNSGDAFIVRANSGGSTKP